MIFSDGHLDHSDNFNGEKINQEVAKNALISIAQELHRYNLPSIAQELQRFQAKDEDSSLNRTVDDTMLAKLNSCTAKMQSKNRQLKKMHHNLKTVCTVARIVMSAKNKESKVLEDQLNMKRKECAELLKNRAENISLIEKLQTENANENENVERVSNIIYLGYKEVQKLRHEAPKEIPVLMALKEILIACGQYYVDFCNERERCTQLGQRNRFLKNKLVIMENDLAACKEDIQNLKILNMRLSRSREWKNSERGDMNMPLYAARSMNDETSLQLTVSKSQLKIASHLTAVKDLLCNQDSMLRDLRKLSEELGALES